MSYKRYICKKAPKVHNVLANESASPKYQKELHRSLYEYDWNEWDRPRKVSRCWKDQTKRRNQYKPVLMY